MILINFGWILFRANSLMQARQMFTALFSASSYTEHFLSGSLYLLVGILAAGYGVVLLISSRLRQVPENGRVRAGVLVRMRWYWIPPLYTLAMMLLLMITWAQDSSGAAQLMYRGF